MPLSAPARLALLLLLLGAAPPAFAQGARGEGARVEAGRVERGKAFAAAQCGRCHAIEARGESPMAEAPPLRELHRRYPVEALAEAFAEGITTGHPEMPEFELSKRQIDDLIAYLTALPDPR
jgi:mono/diheme cytochrome c family protein